MESASKDKDDDLRQKYEDLQIRYVKLLERSHETLLYEKGVVMDQFNQQKTRADRLTGEVGTIKHKMARIDADLKKRFGIALSQRNDVIKWLAKEIKGLPKRKMPSLMKELIATDLEKMDDAVYQLVDMIEDLESRS